MGKRGRGAVRSKASSGVTLLAQGKGRVKRTQLSPFDPAGSDDNVYVVREIKAERLKGCAPQWLIGWQGYTDREDTWEPIENLAGYEVEIREFRERKKQEISEVEAEEIERKKQKREQEAAEAITDDGFEDGYGGKRRSAVWKYFQIQIDEATKKIIYVRCTLCPQGTKAAHYCGNTANLRVHLSSCHKNEYCQLIAADSSDIVDLSAHGESEGTQSTIEALVPVITPEKRDELHKLISLWLVRCGRPLSLPENDQEFRDIFYCLTKGQYVPPTAYNLVVQNILKLSVEGKERLVRKLKALLEEGILPSIGGDIWSQGGISIFGIMVYFVDRNFEYNELLLAAIPFSDVRHTGPELEKATKVACADVGLGEYNAELGRDAVDTVNEYVHASCSDNASNIVAGWKFFDGHECSDHTIALIVLAFLEQVAVRKVFTKLRGMTTHFNHSVIGSKLLRQCQKRHEVTESKPPQDNDTRSGWGGACKQATWYYNNQTAIQMYDVESPVRAATAAPNPDGSAYKEHQLLIHEWDIVRHPPLKYENRQVLIQNEDVKAARELMYKACCTRWFNNLQDCKLEDFAVATFLDPRHKNFKFKYMERFMRGELTVKQVEAWVKNIYEKDWKVAPSKDATDEPSAKRPKGIEKVSPVVSFFGDSDDEDEDPTPAASAAGGADEGVDEWLAYMALPEAKKDVDVLKWWKKNESELPALSRMARQFLGVPASTAGFKGVNLTPAEKMLNKFMSSCREAVEWAFGKVLQYQAYLDFKKNLKILLSPVSNQYKAGVLVTNMHTCLYGCTSSRYFDCDPPTLEEYRAL
ncbi:hypothetical protein CYMTET_9255 [Cymbomonas tetramitiformis]|uniref:Chromo domain-containing protein n=1 Tax=Cymbomonas tetramitiformis TaxID=36881 RepID=A0AAE0GRU1_9CHLO|nr:hypothetical protein CYMTET_9255 [Cymbomonas tetramitiformis]